MVELISLHVPKCGGWSIYEALCGIYGKEAVLFEIDQLENPASPFNIDPIGFMEKMETADLSYLSDKQVITGHIYIGRFNRLRNVPRVTILRHPVERLISQYFFWQYWPGRIGPLRRYIRDNHLNVLEFARLPTIQYYYTRIFFREVDMGIFDFIGNYNRLQESVDRISQLIGKPLALPHANKNAYDKYDHAKKDILNNKHQLATLTELLKDDIAFYERWALK